MKIKLKDENYQDKDITLFISSLKEFTDCSYNEREKIISFSEKGELLKDILDTNDDYRLDYNTIIHMIWYLSKQQSFLEKNGYSLFTLSIDNILVINDSIFLCINPLFIKPIRNNYITFYNPFSRVNGFYSPEILALNEIPSKISYKTFYYSLGALCIFCLFKVNILHNDCYKNEKNIISILTPIYQTKLYWLLLRILSIDPSKREILFV